MSGRFIVFVGPSLAPAERPRTRAVYLPPVRHGDLFRLDAREGDVVLIIDGIYQHVAPLRHKEILAVMSAGVEVFGAASFGALRAAELQAYGMHGIGRVYNAYRTGELSDDAEVALLHTADEDCHVLTVALVSVRFAVADLAAQGRLDVREGERLLALAAALHFTERTPGALRASAGPAMAMLLDYLSIGNVKTRDALDAIFRANAPDGVNAQAPTVRWDNSFTMETALYHRPVMHGMAVTARQVLACLQLFAVDYPARHRAYVWRVARGNATNEVQDKMGEAAAFLRDAGFSITAVAHSRYAAPSAATVDWSPEERAFVRTFRLPPGRGIYLDLPPEALSGGMPELIAACQSLLANSDADRGGLGQWRSLLQGLWSAPGNEAFQLSAMERGFSDVDEALRLAQDFNFPMVRTMDLDQQEILP